MITTHRTVLVMAGLLISLGPPVTVANADGERDRDPTHVAEPDKTGPPSTTLAPVTMAPTTSIVNDAKPTSPSTVPPALTPGDFDVNVPAVEHFSYSVIPTQPPIPWVQLLDLPGAVEGLAIGVQRDGVGVGTVLIVDDFGLATYVNRLFDAPVTIEHSLPLGEGTPVAASEARAVWQSFGGVPVVAATAPDDGTR